jgi:hypothetical protein
LLGAILFSRREEETDEVFFFESRYLTRPMIPKIRVRRKVTPATPNAPNTLPRVDRIASDGTWEIKMVLPLAAPFAVTW